MVPASLCGENYSRQIQLWTLGVQSASKDTPGTFCFFEGLQEQFAVLDVWHSLQ